MAEYNFTYNGITTTVVDTKDQESISFVDPVFTSNTRKYSYKGISTDAESGRLEIVFKNLLLDGVKPITSSKWSTYVGQQWYDYYYSIIPTIPLGTVTARACVNTLLATMSNIYGEPIECFSASNNHTFFHPIEVVLSSTDESGEGASDGTIDVTVNNNPGGHTYEYSIDGGTTWTSTLTGLTAGTYTVITKDVTESTSVGFDVTKSKTVIVNLA